MNSTLNTATDREPQKTAFAFQTGKVQEEANRLTAQFDQHPVRSGAQLLLDLRNVEYMGSEDLGAIVGLHKKVRGAGGRLTLVNVQPKVSEVIMITRLDSLLDIHRS